MKKGKKTFVKEKFLQYIIISIIVGFTSCSIVYGILNTALEKQKELTLIMTDYVQTLEDALSVKQSIQDQKDQLDYAWPIHLKDWKPGPSALSSPFGERADSEVGGLSDGFHEGMDLWGVNHTGPTWMARVVAVADGWVEHWLNHPIKGEYYVLHHDDGNRSEYHHFSRGYIRDSERVKKGDVLGRMGSSGISTGPHLHFQLEINGELVNPLKYIDIPEKKNETNVE